MKTLAKAFLFFAGALTVSQAFETKWGLLFGVCVLCADAILGEPR